jgi:hypothetical protein
MLFKIVTDLENGLNALRTNLTSFVFSALIFGLACSRTKSQHVGMRAMVTSIFHEGFPMMLYSEILIWGQSACCLLVLCICNWLGFNIPHQFATVIPIGVESGETAIRSLTSGNLKIDPETIYTLVQEAETLGLLGSSLLPHLFIDHSRLPSFLFLCL